jgi:hypothetical protein
MVRLATAGSVLVALAFLVPQADAVELSLAVGVDAWSSVTVSAGGGETSADAETGYSLGLEVVQPVSSTVQLGAGVDLLLPRTLEDSRAELSFLAGFVSARWRAFGSASPVALVGRLGYGTWELTFDGSEDTFRERGGPYLAAGITYDLGNHVGIELLAMRLSGRLQVTEPGETFTDDLDLDVATARVRFRF